MTSTQTIATQLKRSVAGVTIVWCALLLPGIVLAESLTVYAELEEPDNYVEGNAEPVPIGPGYELVLAVLAEAGLDADVKVVPWTRLIRALETEASVLGFSMTRTPQREDRFNWVGLIRPVNFKLWALAERAEEIPDSLNAATHLRVSATRGDVVEQYLLSQNFTNLVYLAKIKSRHAVFGLFSGALIGVGESKAESLRGRVGMSIDQADLGHCRKAPLIRNREPTCEASQVKTIPEQNSQEPGLAQCAGSMERASSQPGALVSGSDSNNTNC